MGDVLSLKKLVITWPDQVQLEIVDPDTKGIGEESTFLETDQFVVSGEQSTSENAVPSLSVDTKDEGLFLPCRLRENGRYQILVQLPYARSEAVRLAENRAIWPFVDQRLGKYIEILEPRLWIEKEEPDPATTVIGFFGPRGHVGVVDLSIIDGEHTALFEVLSTKVDYQDEFKSLLENLAEEHIRLIYDIDALASVWLAGYLDEEIDGATLYFHLRRIMTEDDLIEAVETVLARPLSVLRTIENERVKLTSDTRIRVEDLVKRPYAIEVTKGGPLNALFRGYTPTVVPVRHKAETVDTVENQYVKAFLEELQELLHRLEAQLNQDGKTIAASQVESWRDRVSDWLSEPLWRGVGPMTGFPSNSQRLQRTAGYRDILAIDLQLRDALRLAWSNVSDLQSSEETPGDIRPIAELYEYWCFLVMRSIIQRICGDEREGGKSLLHESQGGLALRLAQGTLSHLQYDYRGTSGEAEVHLFYNRNFTPGMEEEWGAWSGSYSSTLHPDISIAVKCNSGTHWLHFDAKYRLDSRAWKQVVANHEFRTQEKRLEDAGTYKRGDLYKMHTYRDAILGTRGSYVLYPGKNRQPEVFVRGGADVPDGALIPSVGAFALRPGEDESQREELASFITQLLEHLVVTQTPYVEEYGTSRPMMESRQ